MVHSHSMSSKDKLYFSSEIGTQWHLSATNQSERAITLPNLQEFIGRKVCEQSAGRTDESEESERQRHRERERKKERTEGRAVKDDGRLFSSMPAHGSLSTGAKTAVQQARSSRLPEGP